MDNFPERVTLYEDGVYRWHYDMDMWKNRYFILRLMRILALSLGLPTLFVAAMALKNARYLLEQGVAREKLTDYLHGDLISLYVIGGIWLGCLLLALIVYAVAALAMRGTWRQCFQMDETSVALVPNPKTMATMQNLGTAMSILSLAAGKGADAVRLNRSIHNAENSGVSWFESVHKVKPMEKYDIVGVRGLILMNPIYVPREDFDFVRDFIDARVREKARSR